MKTAKTLVFVGLGLVLILIALMYAQANGMLTSTNLNQITPVHPFYVPNW